MANKFSSMTAFLSLGGNLGNTREIFEQTYPLIEKKIGRILQKSSLYQTAAWGLTDQADFLNQVIEVETTLDPEAILGALRESLTKTGGAHAHRVGAARVKKSIFPSAEKASVCSSYDEVDHTLKVCESFP